MNTNTYICKNMMNALSNEKFGNIKRKFLKNGVSGNKNIIISVMRIVHAKLIVNQYY